MSSKTKIIVLHKKEVLYTIAFAVFSIVVIGLLVYMFSTGNKNKEHTPAAYTAGIYSSSVLLGAQSIDVEVTVDKDHINSISFKHLDESVSAMYPLMQPALEDIAEQICETQSLENISYSADSRYTSQVLLQAVKNALDKAAVTD